VLPVAGALLGCALGGPLGLLAGFKAAGVAAAVGGSALGFAGGKVVQSQRQAKVDLQMKKCLQSNIYICNLFTFLCIQYALL